jgi:long-chain acyl-CoA synthetase
MTIACALPLYHVFALVVCGLLGMRAGALNVLIPNPRDMKATLATLKKYRINIFPGVNTLFNGLLAQPDFKSLDFSELAITIGGGMAVQSAVAQRWLEVTGCPIVEGYGLSETSAAVVCNRTDSNAYTGTIGMPMPSVEVTILSDDGRRMALNDIGEIAIRGPQVMNCYWQRPDETAKSITADGFFKSGDLGFMDADGLIKIVDRKKDMILVSGFNVYPNEIEDVVACLPGIAECAAVGVPDPVSGEAVALYVVARDPKLTKEDVAAYCRTQLTGYKQPRRIEFRQDLPKTNVGKILRRELRNEAVKS